MGDRRNVVLRYSGNESVTLFTHWGGTELIKTVQEALKRGRGRWGDEGYLARIIFSEIVKDDVLGETGYGLYPGNLGDEDSPSIYVFMEENQVAIKELTWSFTDFIKSDEELSRE